MKIEWNFGLNKMTCWHAADDVYNEIKKRTKDAILVIIDQEREGEQVDRALLKNVLEVYISLGMGNLDTYVRDFEEHLLISSTAFYKRKAAQWIEEDSCPDYMIKAEDSLRLEEERVGNYLHINTKPKLLKVVEQEVLTIFEMQLLEKEQSGCAVLLQDDKVKPCKAWIVNTIVLFILSRT